MLKLYNRIDGQLKYWETWDNDHKTGTIHWGVVGERGEVKDIKSGLFTSFRKTIQKEIDQKIAEGYTELDNHKQYTLLIEFKVNGMGTNLDLEKRTRLEMRMNETLGWTGLGHCDGGSMGSGTMEVCCFVIDFDIAKKLIKEDLAGTEFSDYSRIYDENEN